MATTENPTGTCADVCQHLDELERRGLLVRVDRKTDKDTEIMPLVRWQLRGLPQDQRKGQFDFAAAPGLRLHHLGDSLE
jgi:hypothetical protein